MDDFTSVLLVNSSHPLSLTLFMVLCLRHHQTYPHSRPCQDNLERV